jgi:hypothetical protein
MIEVFDDFLVPLMRILDNLSGRSGVAGDVLRLFEETYRDQLIPYQYTDNESGRIRWAHNVRWSREKLKNMGFLDAPKMGIWRLTQEGHEWLIEHPDASRISGRKQITRRDNQLTAFLEQPEKIKQPIVENKFLASVKEKLSEYLKPIMGSVPYEFVRRANYLQIRLTGFPGCHYEIAERRKKLMIALHFESSAERSQARLKSFEPHVDELTQALKTTVHAGNFNRRGWGQVYIEEIRHPLIDVSIQEDAELIQKFVTATYPILQTAYVSNNRNHHRKDDRVGYEVDSPLYRILDQEVGTIRAYLQGRSLLQPKDEKICDWINLCYMFSLYTEAKELFSLVNEADVNPWYYERTKKISKACEHKALLIKG